mgnify:CR=1 FL=1
MRKKKQTDSGFRNVVDSTFNYVVSFITVRNSLKCYNDDSTSRMANSVVLSHRKMILLSCRSIFLSSFVDQRQRWLDRPAFVQTANKNIERIIGNIEVKRASREKSDSTRQSPVKGEVKRLRERLRFERIVEFSRKRSTLDPRDNRKEWRERH